MNFNQLKISTRMDMLVQSEQANVEKRDRNLHANIGKIAKTYGSLLATFLPPGDANLADAFGRVCASCEREGLLPVADAMLSGKMETARTIHTEKVSPLAPATVELARKLSQIQIDLVRQEYETAVARFSSMRLVSSGGIAFQTNILALNAKPMAVLGNEAWRAF